jgi:type I restriction enzyme, S subunit
MLLSNLNLLATAPGGVARLRELILTLAVQGKLVPQDPKDEPARDLLKRVAANATVRSGKSLKVSGDSDEIAAPYGLPDDWAWSRLGDIVENMGSGWSPACDEGERSDPTKWAVLRTTAVQVNEYRAREHKVIPSKLSPRPEIEVKDGDILITRAGPMNRVGISCWVNNTPPRLMLSDKIVRFHSIADEMLPAFVVLALNAGWTKSLIEQAKTGMAASQVNISQTDLRGFWLPVCSKAEQSRIVTRVEELMRLCDALEAKGQLEATQHAQLVSTLLGTLTQSETPEQLTENWHRIATHFDLLLDRPQAIDALEQTILQLAVRGLLVPQNPQDEPANVLLKKIRAEKDKLIAEGKIKRDKPLPPIAEDEQPFALPQGWEWVRVGHLGVTQTGGTPASSKPECFDGNFPFIGPGQITPAGKILPPEKFISERGRLESAVAESGDILMVCIGGSIGKCAAASYAMAFNQQINSIHPVLASSEYVLNAMSGSEFMASVVSTATGSATPIISKGKWDLLLLPVPPLAEQSRIVTRVAQLRRLCADLRQRLSASQSTQAHLAEALVSTVGSGLPVA